MKRPPLRERVIVGFGAGCLVFGILTYLFP